MNSSPTPSSTPIPARTSLIRLNTSIPISFSFTIYHFIYGYLISTFFCFIYLLLFKDNSMTFTSKFFSSFLAPFAIIAIITRNSICFIFSMIWEALIIFITYIIVPIILIIYDYFFIPLLLLIEYIYRRTKIIWTFIARSTKSIAGAIWDLNCLFLKKVIVPILCFIYDYIIFPVCKFIHYLFVTLIYRKVIAPFFRFICSIRAFQVVFSYIGFFFGTIFDFFVSLFLTIAKICQSVIDAAREIIKETYDQVISPFAQVIKRIFGE